MSVRRTIAALEAHRIAARTLRASTESLGLSQMDLASIANVARSVVRRWIDDDDCTGHAPMRLLLEPMLGPELLARFAAVHGLEITKAPTDLQSAASHLHSLAAVIKEHSDVVLTLSAALADQKLSAAEQERIARECTEAIAALTELRSRMQGASVRTLRIAEER